VKAISEN